MPKCKLCGKDVPHRKLKHLNEVHKLGLAPRAYKVEDYFEIPTKPHKPPPLLKPEKDNTPVTQQEAERDLQQRCEETGHNPVRQSKKKLKVMTKIPLAKAHFT
jgi:hypothetical protein